MRKLLIGLLVACSVWVSSCATVTSVGMSRTITHVRQQLKYDCTIAALAMLAGTTYEAADKARERAGIELTPAGLNARQMTRIARVMGVTLQLVESVRQFNFVSDEGILVVAWNSDDYFLKYHAVYVYRGYVYDPTKDFSEPYVEASLQWAPFYFLAVTAR
jgi:ABC-type bacteriocin/lantibiotic exporter with double-glycine peptidase domain